MAIIYNKNGTSAADTIYVTQPGINVIGDYGNDEFIVQGDAVNNTIGSINNEYGDDKLTIKSGDKITYRDRNGKNTVIILNGMNHNIDTGDDKDTLLIQGGADAVTAYLHNGENEITISTGSNHNISSGNRADKLTVNYMESSTISLGAGENIIKISGGHSNKVEAGDAKDTFTINGGYSNSFYGGYGDDIFYVNANAGSNSFVSGYGNDRFTVLSKSNQTIKLNSAHDGEKKTVLIKAGEGHSVSGTTGNGNASIELYIENASKVTGDLGATKDKVVISSGSENVIDMENNNDFGSIRGGTSNVIKGGDGDDTLSIEGKAGAGNSLEGGNGSDNLYVNAGITGIQTLVGGNNSSSGRDSFNVYSDKAIVHMTAGGHKGAFALHKGKAVDDLGVGHTVESSASENFLYIGDNEKAETDNVKATINGRINNCYIYGSHNSVAVGYSGTSDNVYIRSGDGNYVYTGYDNDFIYIDGGNNHTIRGGQGTRDNFYVRCTLASDTRLTFDQESGNDLRDILHLKNESRGNFSFSYNSVSDVLSIKKNNGALITVEAWKQNRLAWINFKDGSINVKNWDYESLDVAKNEISNSLVAFNTEAGALSSSLEAVALPADDPQSKMFVVAGTNV